MCCAGSGKQQQQPARFNQPISFVSSGVVGSDPMEIRPALQRVTQVIPDEAQPAEPSQTPNITEARQGEKAQACVCVCVNCCISAGGVCDVAHIMHALVANDMHYGTAAE